jgi:hypothetical protein
MRNRVRYDSNNYTRMDSRRSPKVGNELDDARLVTANQPLKKKIKSPGRFSKLKGRAHSDAKRYRLPEEAVRLIRESSKLYGSQGRAIQVAVEMLFRYPSPIPLPGPLDDPPTSAMTYKLTPRTIAIVDYLAKKQYRTRGRVLAACAVVLEKTPETPRA